MADQSARLPSSSDLMIETLASTASSLLVIAFSKISNGTSHVTTMWLSRCLWVFNERWLLSIFHLLFRSATSNHDLQSLFTKTTFSRIRRRYRLIRSSTRPARDSSTTTSALTFTLAVVSSSSHRALRFVLLDPICSSSDSSHVQSRPARSYYFPRADRPRRPHRTHLVLLDSGAATASPLCAMSQVLFRS